MVLKKGLAKYCTLNVPDKNLYESTICLQTKKTKTAGTTRGETVAMEHPMTRKMRLRDIAPTRGKGSVRANFCRVHISAHEWDVIKDTACRIKENIS
jgi:hypothetical protein